MAVSLSNPHPSNINNSLAMMRADQMSTSAPCYITKLPAEVLLKIATNPAFSRRFSKKLRLVNTQFAELLEPFVFKTCSIKPNWCWISEDNPRRYPRRDLFWPRCLPLESPMHRIEKCRFNLKDRGLNGEVFLDWAADAQNAAELVHMFWRLVSLEVSCEWWTSSRDSYPVTTIKGYSFLLSALHGVEHLKLSLVVMRDQDIFSICIKGTNWPHLRHLELCGMSTTISFLQDFFYELPNPLEVLEIDKVRLEPLQWDIVFETLAIKHNLIELRVNLEGRYGDERKNGSHHIPFRKTVEEIKHFFGGKITTPTEKATGWQRNHILWRKDFTANHTDSEDEDLAYEWFIGKW